MFAYFSIQSSSSTQDDDEKLSLLQHNHYRSSNNKKRLPYRRWILFTSIFLFAVNNRFFHMLGFIQNIQLLWIDQVELNRTTKTKGITVVPSIGLQLNWFHALFALLYALILSISLSLRGPIHWYVMPLVVFVGFQLVQATWTLMLDRNAYIREQLDDSWQRAYDSSDDAVLLEHLQTRLQCQGFADSHDRNLPMTTALQNHDVTDLEPCLGKLIATFGQAIYAWGFALWVLKMIQMAGLLGCYAIYTRLADDIICASSDEDDGDDQQAANGSIQQEEKKGHGITRTGQTCVTVT